jgi:hypothetical protein
MFNKKLKLKKIALLIFVLFGIVSCNKELNITFTEFNIEMKENTVIEINVPWAEGTTEVRDVINLKIQNHIANIINFGEDESDIILGDALVKFDSIYIAFKDDFEESSLAWEALIDGEVTYQSSEITCIAINSYLNTGGAHGNMNISFLNFNSQTGELLKNDELIKNKINFIKIAEKYFNLQLQEASNENGFNDYFFGDGFQLPENIGFSDEGIILLYNVYEIAPYSEGITEFTIPFEEMLPYLKLN